MLLRWILLLAVIAMAAGSAAFAQDLREEARKGRRLKPEEVASLEARLIENPQDLALRARLLGYYSRQRQGEGPERHAQQVLWFLRNAPESEVLEGPEGEVLAFKNPAGYEEAKAEWLRLLEEEPRNLVFLRSASSFFELTEPARSAQLLALGESLEPSNPHWARRSAHLLWLEAVNARGETDAGTAARALVDFERAYELSNANGRDSLLPDLGKAAFVLGDMEKARAYAESMLEAPRRNWNQGNRIHYGNLVLGRIALSEGALEEAGARLIAAGETPGSPQLNSFGPDMTLAKALLERGETQTVLRYLVSCRAFWEHGRNRLEDWIVLIEAGRTPDFGNIRW